MEEFKKNKIVIVSGYFNPLHKGHIEYFSLAKKNADKLVVIINNDHQRKLKGSKLFMLEDERAIIVSRIDIVDYVFISIDMDLTVKKSIEEISKKYIGHELFFANGGDQNNDTIPEHEICKKLKIKLIDGLGNKIQSSSWLLNKKNEN